MRTKLTEIDSTAHLSAVLPKEAAPSLMQLSGGVLAGIGCSHCFVKQQEEQEAQQFTLKASSEDLPNDQVKVTFYCALAYAFMQKHGEESGLARSACSEPVPFDVYVPSEVTSQMQLHPLHGL